MRELILKTLQQEKHISGEELGRRLNISRTAVWKHINELRSLGYQIESSTKTGYSFIKGTDLLLAGEIASGLDTQIMGKVVKHFDEVSSTQDIAAGLAREGAVEGTVVIAETQKNGRGRKGRYWLSLPAGGIYLSLILRPRLMPPQVVQIPLITAIAVARAIQNSVPLQARIKWPNDIMVANKKVGGILTELSAEIDSVNYVILGIGLNVNIPASLLPPRTTGAATSLMNECGLYTSRAQLVRSFLSEFERTYLQFLSGGFSSLRNEWKALNNTIGSQVKVNDGTHEFDGEAADIDDDGFLLVRRENGDLSRIISGDVSFRDRYN